MYISYIYLYTLNFPFDSTQSLISGSVKKNIDNLSKANCLQDKESREQLERT